MVKVLDAQRRKDFKKSALSQIRKDGKIPGIIYGKDVDNESITVDQMTLLKMLRDHGRNAVLKLDLEGQQTNVMVFDLQMDTIKNEVIHADFYAVDMKSELDADVPIVPIGDAVGVKKGGVLQQALFEVSVRALPNNLPETIELDVSNLDINDTLYVKDLKIDGDYEINNDLEEVVLSIVPPTDAPAEGEVSEESEANVEGNEGN